MRSPEGHPARPAVMAGHETCRPPRRVVRLLWALVLAGAALSAAAGTPAETPLTPAIRILVLKTEAEAQSAVAAFDAGVPFDRLVREHSIGPSAERGGYLGRVDPATLSPEARAALAKTQPGRLSPIFRTDAGFAVIQVVTEQEEQALEARARREREARELFTQGTDAAKHGDLQGAIPLLQRATQLDPNLADAHFNLAITYGRLNRLDAAIAAMREAIRLHPDDAEAQMNLGRWLSDRGLHAEATQAYERAATLRMNSREAWLKLARSYDAAGKARASVAAYQRVLALLGRDEPAIVRALFRVAMKAGDGPAAVEAAQKLRGFQFGYEGFLSLGEALLLNGQAKDAVREFQKASALAPTSAKAHAGLASAYARLGQGEAAAESYQQAIRLDPKNPELYGRLAHVYEEMGRVDLAIVALRDGVSAADLSPAPLQAELAEQLIALYDKAGMTREAARERLRLQTLPAP
ncbi:MAG TPA: tetratricopeptide repeat protein [Candidatus Methylomirabilis sp.]|nr:tetratricopeptide repeat protein [Candidatus Methylomirabilis sp.]